MNVIKDERAIKEYIAPNGVVLVKTKKTTVLQPANLDKNGKSKDNENQKNPVIIIDGKVSNQEAMKGLSPDDIETIEVVKGEKAMTDYNAPYGVVIIKTKKG